MLKLNILDLEINVALAAVKLGQLLAVVFELLILENPAARDPGKHPVPARLDGAAQLSFREGVCPHKFHVHNPDLRALGDLERGGPPARVLIDAQHILHLRARVTRLLIHLLDFLAVREQLALVQRLANL